MKLNQISALFAAVLISTGAAACTALTPSQRSGSISQLGE